LGGKSVLKRGHENRLLKKVQMLEIFDVLVHHLEGVFYEAMVGGGLCCIIKVADTTWFDGLRPWGRELQRLGRKLLLQSAHTSLWLAKPMHKL
jgi:hypothetical protein